MVLAPVQQHEPLLQPGRLFTPCVTVLFVCLIIMYSVCVLSPSGRDWVMSNLGLTLTSALGDLRLWQFVTHAIIQIGLCGLLFNLGCLIFLASAIERDWGWRGFLIFYLLMSALTGLILALGAAATGQNVLVADIQGFLCAVFGAYARVYRGQILWIFFAKVRAEALMAALLFINALIWLNLPVLLFWLAGAPLGYAYARLRERSPARRLFGRSARSASRFKGIDF